PKPGEQTRQRSFSANRVAIEPGDPRRRPGTGHFGLDPLGPEPGELEVTPGAERARGGHPRRVVAAVTARPPRRAVAVHDQRDAAVGTVPGARALPAEYRGGEPAAIEQNEDLFPSFEPQADRLRERAAQ